MMTTITQCKLEMGKEPTWDAAFKERLASAREQPGWISGQHPQHRYTAVPNFNRDAVRALRRVLGAQPPLRD